MRADGGLARGGSVGMVRHDIAEQAFLFPLPSASDEAAGAEGERLGAGDENAGAMDSIPAGWPEEIAEGCVRLDPAAVLRAKPRSFALRVRGHSMIGAGIYDGDIVVGEFTPEARPGAVVVALIDGESTLKRFVMHNGRPHLASENPNCPDLTPLTELVIQGVVHSIVHRIEKALSC